MKRFCGGDRQPATGKTVLEGLTLGVEQRDGSKAK